MGLTGKRLLFCDEYLIDLNATQAAIRAGYSVKTARSQANELLTKPDIQAYIAEKRKALADKLDISQERVLKEYAAIAFLDIRKVFDSEGRLKPMQELDDETARAIASIESYEEIERAGEETFVAGMNRKVKMWDKRAALDSICKVLGYNAPEKKDVKKELNITGIKAIIPGEDDDTDG